MSAAERAYSRLDEFGWDIDSSDDDVVEFLEPRGGHVSLRSSGYAEPTSSEQAMPVLSGGMMLDVFDPVLFRTNAETAIAQLERHLAEPSIRGLDLRDPAVLLRQARALMTSEHENIGAVNQNRLKAIIDLYIKTGIQVHSPGYMGRQFSGVVPLAAVIDLVSSVVNQPASFYEAGQLPIVAERIMADELNRYIGWKRGRFAMVTTSGGSLANLTALLAARSDKFPRFWSEGAPLAGQARPAVAVGEDVHYSVSRAVGITGIGANQVVRLPLNEKKQICMNRVRPALAAAERRGLKVFCLVASAGSTSVGAFDPIDELADLAREKDIWLHVDGAHGGSLLLSDRLRHKLKGIEKADSFTWDAHKMLFVPAMCTMLFYKNKEKSYGAFRQTASYVFEETQDIYTELDNAPVNFECTKRPLIMNLWVLWAIYGKALFADKIDYLCQLTDDAYKILRTEPDFQTLHRPEANILCFRYSPPDVPEVTAHGFQVAIRNRLKQQGRFFISKVNVDGVGALRVVMMNHLITTEHFRMLLDEIRRAGQSVLHDNEIRLNNAQ